ncbi:MAG: ParB N-terminal domain-containing protein [Clostridiales bacterium]|jgi:ParB family chromosome partitioning protein|nr:ParB N-terminal domain-containing protein [Clostridiales bacterium]
MAEATFQLKNMRDIFRATDPLAKPQGDPVYNIALAKLRPFESHPFKLYSGQRFEDMAQSVRANGVLVPIIIRPQGEFNYEILSGHNRVEASRAAGLETIPCIIRDGLADDEALLIVTETNMRQRSFADLTHSERAAAISAHYDAIKKQGKRTDLIVEIENMFKASNNADSETYVGFQQKLNARDKTASDYGLNSNTIVVYLRVNKLNPALKERLDNGCFSVNAAVSLSYLSDNEQRVVDDILDSGNYKLDMKKASALRAASAKNRLDHKEAEQILAGKKKPKSVRQEPFKLKPKIISRYFGAATKPDEIEETIIAALEFYYKTKGGLTHEGLSGNDAAGEALPSEISG